MSTTRRQLLAGVAAVPPLLLVAGCQAAASLTPAQVAAAQAELTAVIADVKSLGAGLPAGSTAAADLVTQIAALTTLMQGLTTNSSLSSALSTAQTILTAVGQYLPVVLTLFTLLAPRQGAAPEPPAMADLRTHWTRLQGLSVK